MKILHVIQSRQLRGAEIFAAQLSYHLQKSGHEVKILCLIDAKALLPFDVDIICVNANMKFRFFDFRAWKAISDVINKFKPDIIQSNAGDTLKYIVFSKIIFRWNSAIIFRNANKVSDFINSFWVKKFNKFLYNYVDFVASVSRDCKQDFIRQFNFDTSKISFLPIGVECDAAPQYFDLSEFNIKKGQKVIINVASFVKEKNHVGLIRIFNRIHKNYRNVILLLIGEGILKSEIEREVQLFQLQESVIFAGVRNDVLSILQSADVLALPSLIEGLPGVILESFFTKTPVVAYNVGGISEVVTESTGFLVDKGNEEVFFDKLLEVLNSSNEEIKNITECAYNLVKQYYDNRAISERFINIYKYVLKKKLE